MLCPHPKYETSPLNTYTIPGASSCPTNCTTSYLAQLQHQKYVYKSMVVAAALHSLVPSIKNKNISGAHAYCSMLYFKMKGITYYTCFNHTFKQSAPPHPNLQYILIWPVLNMKYIKMQSSSSETRPFGQSKQHPKHLPSTKSSNSDFAPNYYPSSQFNCSDKNQNMFVCNHFHPNKRID